MSNLTELFNEIKEVFKSEGVKTEAHKFEDIVLADGTLAQVEPSVSVGSAVVVQSGDELVTAPDGKHELSDGRTIVVSGGVITEVLDTEDDNLQEPKQETMEDAESVAIISEVISEVSKAKEEIAEAIDGATPSEVTPELAGEVAEIVVAIVEDKAQEITFSKKEIMAEDDPERYVTIEDWRGVEERIANLEDAISDLKRDKVAMSKEIKGFKAKELKSNEAFNKVVNLLEVMVKEPKKDAIKKNVSGFQKAKKDKTDIVEKVKRARLKK